MARKEKKFQTEIGASFSRFVSLNPPLSPSLLKDIKRCKDRALSCFEQEIDFKSAAIYHKIVDTGVSKNPYDCFFIYDGKYVAMELKISKEPNRIDIINQFNKREHEISALLRTEASGFPAYVVINVFLGRGKNWAYAWRIEDYLKMCAKAAPRKSIKLSNVMDYDPIIIRQLTGGLWDVSPLFL